MSFIPKSTLTYAEYQYVLFGTTSIIITYVISMYRFTMGARLAVFRRSHMRQFDELHQKEFPLQPKAPDMGYPDCGTGYYSKKLPYADWFKINCG